MIPIGPVIVRKQLAASREQVWHFLVNTQLRDKWFAGLEFGDARGAVAAWAAKSGIVDVYVRGHVLGFSWAASGELPTSVLITLRTAAEGTLLTVTETGFDALVAGEAAALSAEKTWTQVLHALGEADLSAAEVPAEYLQDFVDPATTPVDIDEAVQLETTQIANDQRAGSIENTADKGAECCSKQAEIDDVDVKSATISGNQSENIVVDCAAGARSVASADNTTDIDIDNNTIISDVTAAQIAVAPAAETLAPAAENLESTVETLVPEVENISEQLQNASTHLESKDDTDSNSIDAFAELFDTAIAEVAATDAAVQNNQESQASTATPNKKRKWWKR